MKLFFLQSHFLKIQAENLVGNIIDCMFNILTQKVGTQIGDKFDFPEIWACVGGRIFLE